MFCKYCGNENGPADRYCKYCGKPIYGEVLAPSGLPVNSFFEKKFPSEKEKYKAFIIFQYLCYWLVFFRRYNNYCRCDIDGDGCERVKRF